MKDIAQQLRAILETVEPQLSRMNYDDMGFKPTPHMELLGRP
jgi:hypothetical protein